MSEFCVITSGLSKEADVWGTASKEIKSKNASLNSIRNSLPITGSVADSIKESLKNVSTQMEEIQRGSAAVQKALADIISSYEKAERNIKGTKVSDGTDRAHDGSYTLNGVWDTMKSSFKDNFRDNLRDALLEGTGNTMVRVGGLINVITSTARGVGENAFVIVNPNVMQTTSKWISAGSKIATGAKIGLPVIGGILDYVSLRNDGSSQKDSLIKASAHVGIGLVGGEAGAAIGAAVGSVVPVAGTAVGAAVGFVSGVAISTVGNWLFDTIYDNRDAVGAYIQKVGDTVVSKVSEFTDNIGNAVSVFGKQIGTVFG